jgi:hypothetical protein
MLLEVSIAPPALCAEAGVHLRGFDYTPSPDCTLAYGSREYLSKNRHLQALVSDVLRQTGASSVVFELKNLQSLREAITL